MKVKSLLAVGFLAPAISSAIVLMPAASAGATTTHTEFSVAISCDRGFAMGGTGIVSGIKCGGVPDGTYSNAFLAIQDGIGLTGGFSCTTVTVSADGEAARGTGCTLLSD